VSYAFLQRLFETFFTTLNTGCVSESGDLAAVFFPGLAGVGRMPLLPPSSLLQSVLVAMEPWTGVQRAFAVKAFYKNGDSFVIAQREFRREFGIHRNRAVPSAHAIKTWVQNFEATGCTLKKEGGSIKTARTSENVAAVREATERSPCRSAHRHATSLGPSEASVRRISTPIKFKLLTHYMNTTMKTELISARLFCN
jgi:hypothetical protein